MFGLAGIHHSDGACVALCVPWHGRFVNACGKLGVRVSGAALARCAVFIGHDSGPTHLTAAAGAHSADIFASRNLPGEWLPCGYGHRVLYRAMPCQGCQRGVCEDRQKACIRSITVTEVLDAVDACMTATRSDDDHARQSLSRSE